MAHAITGMFSVLYGLYGAVGRSPCSEHPHSPHEYWIDNKNVIGTVLMGSYLNSVFKAEAVRFCFLPSR